MAQQATTPKIEELRFRLKSDAKSRLFYQLAEELRKVKGYEEAEQVLRAGLTNHPSYLAAWVSLGRVLREEGKHRDAVDALTRALQVDPGNVVAARLMGDAFIDLGDKVEAIKKYKLVRALMPTDEDLNALIDRLEDEINPVTIHQPVEQSFADETMPGIPSASPADTLDGEPMRVAHDVSPFEEPAPSYTAAAVDLEQPPGIHIEPAPPAAEVPAEEEPASDVFAPAEDAANTVTMADLYVRQGFTDRAKEIYQSILQREPDNADVRAKLQSLEGPKAPNPKVKKLETWLARVKGGEEPRV